MNQDFATSTELLKHVFSEITGRYAIHMVISVHEYLLTTCTPNLYFKKILKLFFQEQTTYFVGFLYFIKKCIIA